MGVLLEKAVTFPETEIGTGSEEQLDSSGPRIPMPTVRLVASTERSLVLHLRTRLEHLRYRRRLPACLHQWTETQCLRCHRWSPHSDWYH